MRFYTRKEERAAIVAILDDASYASGESMADAILKKAFELVLERDFYLTIMGSGNAQWGYGLATTEGEAKKLALVAPARVLTISSAQRKLREIEGEA